MLSKRKQNSRKRKLFVESLECRRVLAASLGWDGPGLGSAELTYHVANSPASLSQAETNAAIATALEAWSSVADITFTPTNQAGLRDSIDITFTNIDGLGGTLAQAYFPDDVNPARIAGDIQFDTSEAWEVGNLLGSQAFDLVYVAVHEIGHSLGLDHALEGSSVLGPFVSANQSFASLSAHDIEEIQNLYASTDESAQGTPTDETSVEDSPVDDSLDTDTDTDTTDGGDADDDPFPRRRWRRGGHWHRFGGRLDANRIYQNYVNPTDVNGDSNTSALDALMIINQLNRSSGIDDLGDVEMLGLCDTNGDGSITAIDALTVINTLNNGEVVVNATDSDPSDAGEDTEIITVLDDTIDPADEVNDTSDPVDDVDDTTAPVDDVDETTDPVDEVDDTTAPVDEVDDTTDPVDDVDDEIDDTEDTDPIDDGGVIDETDDSDLDDEHCHEGGHHHGGILRGGLLGKSPETLITRFDTDADSALSESEVPSRLWTKLTELQADADADGLVTLDELDIAAANALQTAFADLDGDTDGVLTEAELSARLWNKISPADTDENGEVSLDELGTLLAEQEFDPANNAQEGFQHTHRHHHRASDAVFAQLGSGRLRRHR